MASSSVLSIAAALGGFTSSHNSLQALGIIPVLLAGSCLILTLISRNWATALLVPISLWGCFLAVNGLGRLHLVGGWGYWGLFWGFLATAILAIGHLSLSNTSTNEASLSQRFRDLLPPASVPFILLLLWQGLVTGFQIPKGIFPGVNHVSAQLSASLPVLMSDSYTTFVKEVLFGFSIGFTAGFLTGVAIAYSRFLQGGFLPLAAAFGAVPIVGLAPVLGRAFGVDWESKAAVVVIVTFFPVVLNTVQGLIQLDPLKLELLQSYAAKPHHIFFKLRLPNALPYIFNALKLSAVLSVISVIVAEFLIPGPPRGLGQRISLSARQGAYDVVFAAIFVSSIISISIYGMISAIERAVTSWHPSFRDES